MSSTTGVVPTSPQERPSAIRSNSVASTASSGGASLRRRSRTRTRTLTSVKRGKSLGTSGSTDDGVGEGGTGPSMEGAVPPLPPVLRDELVAIEGLPQSDTAPWIAHPSRRPRTAGSERRPIVVVEEPTNNDPQDGSGSTHGISALSRYRQTKSEGGSVRGMRLRAASLPRHAFKTTASSDSSSQPSPRTPGQACQVFPLVRIAGGNCPNIRDSVLTQISTTSSSLYPASTVTATHTESSMPYSLDDDEDERMPRFSPEIVSPEKLEFDADDVSYRLRLLMNNSYFLPPAHAKPSPMSLSPQDVVPPNKAPQKASNSHFLDFLRIGKSKSKSTTPIASPPAVDHIPGPILRTTSDSTTASGFAPRPHAHSLPHTPIRTNPPPHSMTRVVVVRERVDDLITAAKEADQGTRTLATVRKSRSRAASRRKHDQVDIIDPTDAVDLPPPSASYPFAIQTSNAHGLGVRESIGAEVLAEQLPPTSPGIWSSSSEDDSWRKALLHEVISHSLSNSADMSFATTSTDQSGLPSPTPRSGSTSSALTTKPSDASSQSMPKKLIGQQILADIAIPTMVDQSQGPATPTRPKNVPITGNTLATFLSIHTVETRTSLWHPPPGRADTPAETHALTPPPRRQLVNPVYSFSQPDLSDPRARETGQADSSGVSRPSIQALRKIMSSPGLSDVHDANSSAAVHMLSLSPPPIIPETESARSSPAMQNLRATSSFSSYRSMMSACHLSDDLSYATPADTDVEQPEESRQSVTVSVVSENRPSISMSEYSHPSPTASAFHDAIFGSCRPPSVLSRRSYMPEASGSSRGMSPLPTAAPPPPTAVSPPPRVSSLFGPPVLSPPPRASAAKPIYGTSISSRATDPGHSSLVATMHSLEDRPAPNASSESLTIAVPTVSLAERRGQSSVRSLRIPMEIIPPSIHSAPAPASPTEFFDRIEAAMDELHSFDESDEDEQSPERAPMFVQPSARADSIRTTSISTRMRNHSSPHLAHSSSHETMSSAADRKKPISNVPERSRRGSYFSSKKKDLVNSDIPLLPLRDLPTTYGKPSSSGSMSHRPSRRRPATAGSAEERSSRWRRESLQKFDGMLVQHMEAERDRIKQITSGMSSSKS